MTSGTDPIQHAGPEALGTSRTPLECREIAPGVHFLAGFGNTTILVGAEAAAVVDPGLFTNGPRVVRELRHLTDLPLRYVIYTHGHYDHAFGTPALLEDAAARGHEPPDIVGHVNVARRFERYAKTAGHLAGTFDAQFAMWGPDGGDVVRRARYFPPTVAYEDRLLLDGLGGLPLECRHGLGETDDHTWVWLPGPRVVVGGDFIVSSLPNAGTPFRVQRYVLEWAEALEEMAALEPAAIVSGHGGRVPGPRRGDAADHGPGPPVPRRRGGPPAQRGAVAGADPGRGRAARGAGRQLVPPAPLRMHRLRRPGRDAPVHGLVRREPVDALPQPAGRRRRRGRGTGRRGGPMLDRARRLGASDERLTSSGPCTWSTSSCSTAGTGCPRPGR